MLDFPSSQSSWAFSSEVSNEVEFVMDRKKASYIFLYLLFQCSVVHFSMQPICSSPNHGELMSEICSEINLSFTDSLDMSENTYRRLLTIYNSSFWLKNCTKLQLIYTIFQFALPLFMK